VAGAPSGTVTFLFTDLVGSTELLDKLGDDEAERLRQAHFRLLREAVAGRHGQEVKNLGDGLMVAFASAVDALACAVVMQEAVRLHNQQPGQEHPLEVRIGLHVGEPLRDEDDYFGTPVVVAKRLCDSAQGGRILVSELVRGLVGSRGGYVFRVLGPLALKGFAEPLSACEVVWEPDGWIDVEARGLRKLSANKAFRVAGAALVVAVIGGATAGGLFLSGAVGGSGSPAGAEYRELDYRLVNGTGSFQVVSGDCQSSDIIFRGTASNDVSGDISGHMTFSGDGTLYVSDRCQWGATPGTFTITDQGGNTLSGVSDFPLHYGTSPSAGPAVQDPAAPMAFIYTGGTGIYEGATGRARCLGPVALTAQRGSSTAVAISAQSAYEKDCTSQVALGAAAAGVEPVILEMAAGVVKMAVFASPVALPKKAYFAVLYMNTRNEPQTGLSLTLRSPQGVEMRAAARDEKDPATGERVWALPDLAPREVGRFVFSVTFLSAKSSTVPLVAEIDGGGFDPVRSDPLEIEVVQ
jgi:class 3 adenylate cyclase